MAVGLSLQGREGGEMVQGREGERWFKGGRGRDGGRFIPSREGGRRCSPPSLLKSVACCMKSSKNKEGDIERV